MLVEALLQDQNSLVNKIIKLERQNQVNLNSRLDKMRFNDYTESEFNSSKPHKSDEVSFVTNSSGDISLYKGDVLLSGKGGDLSVTYAYVTDKDRGKGYIEQQCGNRNYRGKHSENDVYSGPKKDRKLGNIIVDGLQIGLDSYINVETMRDGNPIQSPAFVGGFCPYISFNIQRKHTEVRPNGDTVNTIQNEMLEYWISLERIDSESSYTLIHNNGLAIPERYKFYYKIKGRRTIKSFSTTQEFDIPGLFESERFNYKAETESDAISWNGLRLACSDVKYTGFNGEIKDPVLSTTFNDIPSGTTVKENPYVSYTSYLLETKDRPFGLRFDPVSGEKLEPPRMIFGDSNEKEMAYIIAFKDDEEVKS